MVAGTARLFVTAGDVLIALAITKSSAHDPAPPTSLQPSERG
jgi:hypothetical protein